MMIKRLIKRITMPLYGTGGESGIYYITPGSGPNDYIEWEDTDYGDHGEPYIKLFENGVEFERINPRFVISVEWEED